MPAIVYSGQPGLTDAILFTSVANGSTISKIFAVNATGAAVTVTLTIHRVISGNIDTIASAVSVAANTMVEITQDRLLALGEYVLENGDTLHGSASAAASVTVTATA